MHEINVTPFIDVMPVLLIIFMIAAPHATVDVPVDLPGSTAAQRPRPAEPVPPASVTAPAPAEPQAMTPPGPAATDASPAVAEDVPVDGPPDFAPEDLPRDLSPLGMFLNADIVVQLVMLGLVFASVLTWTVWLVKSLELLRARARARRAQRHLAKAETLGEAAASACLDAVATTSRAAAPFDK